MFHVEHEGWRSPLDKIQRGKLHARPRLSTFQNKWGEWLVGRVGPLESNHAEALGPGQTQRQVQQGLGKTEVRGRLRLG